VRTPKTSTRPSDRCRWRVRTWIAGGSVDLPIESQAAAYRRVRVERERARDGQIRVEVVSVVVCHPHETHWRTECVYWCRADDRYGHLTPQDAADMLAEIGS
jgi:hypothetical protein